MMPATSSTCILNRRVLSQVAFYDMLGTQRGTFTFSVRAPYENPPD